MTTIKEFILHPPVPDMINDKSATYRFLLELWIRSGGYTPATQVDLKDLTSTSAQLNTLNGIRVDDTVQQQLDANAAQAALGAIAYNQMVNSWQLPLEFSNNIASIQKSDATHDGYLSVTDWGTFNNKEPAIPIGTSLQYWRGDKSWQTLNTAIVPELTNLYYTDVRARNAISSTVTGLTYTPLTGVLSLTSGYVIPTTTEKTNWNDSYNKRVDTWTSPLGFAVNTASIQVANAIQNGYLSSTDWNIFNNKQVAGNYITGLTSDVSATGPGSVAATVNSVGTSSATNVHSAELLANAATALNTVNTIVKRNASGRTAVSLHDDNAIPKLSVDHNNRLLVDSSEKTSINWSGSSISIYDTAGAAVQCSIDRANGVISQKGLILNAEETLTKYDFDTLTRFAAGIWPFDPLVVIKAEIIGYTVTLKLAETLAVADTASYIIIGTLPSDIRPLANLQLFVPRTVNNGVDANVPSLMIINTTGIINIYNGVGNFSGVGSSGFRAFSVTYSVG